jgi:hypothetical protein
MNFVPHVKKSAAPVYSALETTLGESKWFQPEPNECILWENKNYKGKSYKFELNE